MNVKTPSFDDVDELKRQWTEKFVQVDDTRPELKRFAGRTGRVITVNMSGRAMVQFDDDAWGWGRYDIALPFLKQVAAPATAAKEKAEKHAAAEKPTADAAVTGEQKPTAKMSPIEMMRAKAAAKAAGEKPAADAPPEPAAKPAGKMSPLEMIRAKAAAKAGQSETKPTEEPAASGETKPAGKMSPLEMIRAKAAAKKAAEEGQK